MELADIIERVTDFERIYNIAPQKEKCVTNKTNVHLFGVSWSFDLLNFVDYGPEKNNAVKIE